MRSGRAVFIKSADGIASPSNVFKNATRSAFSAAVSPNAVMSVSSVPPSATAPPPTS